MSGKYTPPKTSSAKSIDAESWCQRFLITPLRDNEFSSNGSPEKKIDVILPDGKETQSIPLERAGIVFTNFKVLQKETEMAAAMVSAQPVAIVSLEEGFQAKFGLMHHSKVNVNDEVIPLGHPTGVASRWLWDHVGSGWLAHSGKPSVAYEPQFTCVALLSALQSVLYGLSQQTEKNRYEFYMQIWVSLLDVAFRFWLNSPAAAVGPLDALWYDDKSNDSMQRAIACWIYPLLFTNRKHKKDEKDEKEEKAQQNQHDLEEKRMIMLEIMLRRHWKSREGNKKKRNLWDELPYGMLSCTFLLPFTSDILKGQLSAQQLSERMHNHYTQLNVIKQGLKREHKIQADHDDQCNAHMLSYVIKILAPSCLISIDQLCKFAKQCYDWSQPDNQSFSVCSFFNKHEAPLPFMIETKDLIIKYKQKNRSCPMAPRMRLVSRQQNKDNKENKEDKENEKEKENQNQPPGGLGLEKEKEEWKHWKLNIEPSDCGNWNGFVIPTNQELKQVWQAFVCGGAEVKTGRTWGFNGFASFRFTLSEFKEKGVHDVLGRLEGVSSTGVKYDPSAYYVNKGGWKEYSILDITKPFVLEINKTHVSIRSIKDKNVWWTIRHDGRPLVIGFNYVRFQVEPYHGDDDVECCDKPAGKSPVGLLVS